MPRSTRPHPDGPARAARAPGFAATLALSLAIVLALGLAARAVPYTWDQAVFALGAQAMDRGAVLYRDFWDFKQPGIFVFFWLAGRTFGFDEAGTHTFELAWMLVLSAALAGLTRRWFARASTAALTPVLVVGFHYAIATDWHLLQVEGLAILPLLVALWPGARAGASPGRASAFGAGVAGGVALTFKFAFAPLLALGWAHAAWTAAPSGTPPPERTRRAFAELAPRIAGSALVLGAMILAFALSGALREAWWTWVEFPLQVLRRIPGLPWASLVRTGAWVLREWWPLLALAGVGAVCVTRRPGDRAGHSLLVWLAGALLVIVLQRWSGYEFHAWLLLVPLGLLAALGAETIATAGRTRAGMPGTVAAAVLMLALFVGPFVRGASRVMSVAKAGAWRGAALAEEQRRASTSDAYRDYERMGAVPGGPAGASGPMQVFGNPLAYWVLGRAPASAYPVAMSVYGEAQWNRIADDLERTRPAWVLVEDPAVDMLRAGRPATNRLLGTLTSSYRTGPRMGPAVWLERVRD